jgi:DNA repair protein Rad18
MLSRVPQGQNLLLSAMMSEGVVRSSSDWQASIHGCLAQSSAINALETHAQCPVCYDFYTHCVTLPCFHSFCSLCIRRALAFHTACPLCHAPATSGDLRPNFQLSAIAAQVKTLRRAVEEDVTKTVQTAWNELRARRREERRKRGESAENADMIDSDVEETTNLQAAAAAASSSASASASSSDKVDCPICSLKIVASRINRHLDECLGKQENVERSKRKAEEKSASAAAATAAAAAGSSSASRLSFPVYNMMSERAIKKILTSLGFPVNSLPTEKEALVRRHREFVLRHNAEADGCADGSGAERMSDAAIVREIVRKEKVLASTSSSKNAKQSLLLEAFTTQEPAPSITIPSVAPAAALVAPSAAAAPTSSGSKKRSSTSAALLPPASTSPQKRATRSSPRKRNVDKSVQAQQPVQDLTSEEKKEAAKDESTPSALHESMSGADPIDVELQVVDEPANNSVAAEVPAAATSSDVDVPPAVPTAAAGSASAAPAPSLPYTLCPIRPSSTDPFASLIAAYEAINGPRKRWRRRWGEDESLYKRKPPPQAMCTESISAAEGPGSHSTAGVAVSTTVDPSAVMDTDEVSIDDARTTRTSKKKAGAKPVFALFSKEKETDAPPQAASSAPSSAPPSISSSGSKSSTPFRVPTAICTSCHTVCRGSFPLGATVVCQRCRPNWTAVAAASHAGGRVVHQHATLHQAPTSNGKPNWTQLAQLQPTAASTITPNSASSSASSAATATLSEEQRQVIEFRRIVAMEKLERLRAASKQQQQPQIENQQHSPSEQKEEKQIEVVE